jgi:biotin carboxylase
MPLSKIENRELLGSKAGFSNLCAKYGIRTPRFLIYKDGMTNAEIINYMQLPFLMKVDKSEGGYGIFLCETEKDLTENLAQVADKNNLVFQQFIMGKFGVSTQRLFYSNTAIEEELFKIGRCLGVNGFGNVVFMYNELDNTHYLIEVDVRPNAWMYYGKYTGNDFSEAVSKIVKGDLSMNRQKAEFENKKIKINLFKKDMHRCIQEKDLKGLMEWLINKDSRWRYIPLYDLKLLGACNRFLVKVFGELVRGKFKKIFHTAQ